MLALHYLAEAKNLDLASGLNLLAVRKPPSTNPVGFVHVPQLSPSLALFRKTQQWKKQSQHPSEWWPEYVQQFIAEMRSRPDMVRALARLEQVLRDGVHVRLFCYCKDVRYCHRLLIGEEIVRRGMNVDFRFQTGTT